MPDPEEAGQPCPRRDSGGFSASVGPSSPPLLSRSSTPRGESNSSHTVYSFRHTGDRWGSPASVTSYFHLLASMVFLPSLCFRLLRPRSLLVPFCLAFALGSFVPFGFCINLPTSFVSVSRESSNSLSPLEVVPLSRLETTMKDAPALNLEEDEHCLFTDTVPENVKKPLRTVELHASQWAEHVQDGVFVQDTLKAYQTTDTPGREREFVLSFKLPDDLAETGQATLSLHKNWDGSSHQWGCDAHKLVVTRLSDDKYLQGRNASSETSDLIEWEIGQLLISYMTDVSSLVYGKGLQGKSLHLLFREKTSGCLSSFETPTDPDPPVLKVEAEGMESIDAVYGGWQPYSECRVSCITSVNYQCRKRSCTPAVNDGVPCKMELMVDKQPCSDPKVSEPCTCQMLNEQNACPQLSVCDDSVPNNVSCRCPGVFTRQSLEKKTVCESSKIQMPCPLCMRI